MVQVKSTLHLKVGAQVMLMQRLRGPPSALVNGSRGVITRFAGTTTPEPVVRFVSVSPWVLCCLLAAKADEAPKTCAFGRQQLRVQGQEVQVGKEKWTISVGGRPVAVRLQASGSSLHSAMLAEPATT